MTDGGSSGSWQLACALAILLATGGALAAAGTGRSGSPDSVTPTAGLDPAELVRVSGRATPAVARRVERIRGLSFERVPTPRVVSAARFHEISMRERERTGAFEGIAADEAVVKMLGLLPPAGDLRAAFSSTSDLAAAAYDTRAGRLYVISDAVGVNRALVEFVLAHELNHALEDQRFELREPGNLNDDGALAGLALIEGSATAAMVDYGSVHLGLADLLAATAGLDTSTRGVPDFLVEQLEWAYLGGNRFIGALRRVGGGWKLVDYALSSRPPTSTEQILHPVKYLADEAPLPVRFERQALGERGWRLADQGVAGEFATGQLLRMGTETATARRAAAGWGGDRYALWRRDVPPAACEGFCRADLALVLRWRWDGRRDGREFARAARSYITQGLNGAASGRRSWALEDGYAALAGSGLETTLAFAPSRALALALSRDPHPRRY